MSYTDHVTFSEQEFLRILNQETAFLFKHTGPNLEYFLGDSTPKSTVNCGINEKVCEMIHNVNLVYNDVMQGFIPVVGSLRCSLFYYYPLETLAMRSSVMESIYEVFINTFPRHIFGCQPEVFKEAIRIYGLPWNKYSDTLDGPRAKEAMEDFYNNYRLHLRSSKLALFDKARDIVLKGENSIFICLKALASIVAPLTAFYDYRTQVLRSLGEVIPTEKRPSIWFYVDDKYYTDGMTPDEYDELNFIYDGEIPRNIEVPIFEMKAVDYFELDKTFKHDKTGFFTSFLIAYTLAMKDSWYDWRERSYTTDKAS